MRPGDLGVVAIVIPLRALEAIRLVDPRPIEHLGGVARPAFFFMVPVWLSLFSSEVSMLADTGRFAQASSQAN